MVSILGSLPHFLRKRAHEMTKAKESQNADIVIYNRVPKCASSVMMRLISILHQPYAHDFQFENQIEPGQAHWFETAVDEEEWALDLALREKPTFVLRHQYFVDLDKYSASKNLYPTTSIWLFLDIFRMISGPEIDIFRMFFLSALLGLVYCSNFLTYCT